MMWTYMQVDVMGWFRGFGLRAPCRAHAGCVLGRRGVVPHVSSGGSEFVVSVPLLVNSIAVAKGAEQVVCVAKAAVEKRAAKPFDTSDVTAQMKHNRQR